MSEIEGFILAGGASSRMGRDKALLELGGEPFVERIAQSLAHIAGGVSIVGDGRANEDWRWPVVPDVYSKWGALGGLHAALSACRAEWAAVVACDLPLVSAELLARLAARRQTFDAVVPVQADGRVQPLCALYRRAPCVAVAHRLIESGERRPRALLELVRTRRVAFAEIADISGANGFFINVNTPEDLALAQKNLAEESGQQGIEN